MNQPILDAARSIAKPGAFNLRDPQAVPASLQGMRIVSADNHLCLGGEDVWYNRVPEHIKGRVPRVWFDREKDLWMTGFDGKTLYPFGSEAFVHTMEGREGAWNVDVRTADLAGEGVSKEIAFPQLLPVFFTHPDLEVREWIFRAYNQYLAELQARQPCHFYGVGIPNYWQPYMARESIQEIVALGLKTCMLPSMPGRFADGSEIHYADAAMEPLWNAIEEAGLPVCFHIGENITVEGRGALAITALNSLGAIYFRRNFGQMVFGGILDRNPGLKVVFCEGNLHWIPGMLQDAETIYDSFGEVIDELPRRRPSEYWSEHCYATFMHDPAGLALIDRIGADRVMWSSDYLHNEGTFGYSADVMVGILQAVGPDKARNILGETAIRVFGLER